MVRTKNSAVLMGVPMIYKWNRGCQSEYKSIFPPKMPVITMREANVTGFGSFSNYWKIKF